MGTAKQLTLLEGRPLLAHAVDAARASDEVDQVIVVLGAHERAIRAGVKLTGVDVVRCADWSRGTAVTLRAGLKALAADREAVILLGDQPRVQAAAIARVLERVRDTGGAARAAHGGRPGHPLALSAVLVAELRGADRRGHGRDLLAPHVVDLVACDDLGGGDDVDTPEDLARV